MNENMSREEKKLFLRMWIDACNITKEQKKKLNTKHTDFKIEPVAKIYGSCITMKYHIIFYKGKKEVDTVKLQMYCVDIKNKDRVPYMMALNWKILELLMEKFDEIRNDGTKSEVPDWFEFLMVYSKWIGEAERNK